jgi:hypothetical protein
MKKAASWIGLICGLSGLVIGVFAIVVVVFVLLGYPTVRFKGATLDADWPTAALLAAVALVFLGISWLLNRAGKPSLPEAD